MSSRFDGAEVLTAIARHPAAFPALKGEIDATARKMLLKQLKAASLNLDVMTGLLSVVGEPTVRIGFDEMTAKELTVLARRLDPANADLSSMSAAQLGDHLCALGRGEATPLVGKKVAASPAAKRRPKKELSKIGEVLNSKVHSGEALEPGPSPAKTVRSKKGGDKKA